MGIDFKMIKIHEIVVDSGPICKQSSGKSWELHYFMQRPTSVFSAITQFETEAQGYSEIAY